MAKQIGNIKLAFSSSDEGTTKNHAFHYDCTDTVDPSMMKAGSYVTPTPDYTKSVDTFFSDAVAAIKTAEGIS